jgi:hypothetical protein
MQLIYLWALLFNNIVAQDIDDNNIPSECRRVCARSAFHLLCPRMVKILLFNKPRSAQKKYYSQTS